MTASTKTALSLWFVVLAALGCAVHEARLKGELDAATANVLRQQDADRREAAAVRRRDAAVKHQIADYQRLVAARQSGANPAPRSPAMATKYDPNSPENLRRLATQEAAFLRLYYAALAHQLNLSKETAQKLDALLLKRQQNISDIYMAASSEHISASRPEIAAMMQQQDTNLATQVDALLGAGGYQRLQAYNQSFGARQIVSALAADLCFSSAPLSAEQCDRMTQALASTQSAGIGLQWALLGPDSGISKASPAMAESAAAASSKVRSALAATLSTSQRAVLENDLAVTGLDLKLSALSTSLWRSVRKQMGRAASTR